MKYRFKGYLPAVFAAIAGLIWIASSSPASEPEAGSLDLQVMIEEALERNPEIQGAKHAWLSAQNVPSQAGSLPDPTLMLGLRNVGFNRLTVGEEMMSNASVGLGQMIPFPGKLGLREEIARKDAERMGDYYRATVLSVIADLKEAYFDYTFVERSIGIIYKDKDLLESFERTAQVRYEVGKGIQQDVLKAQVEVSMLLERLKVKEQERQEVRARINRLLNRPPSDPLPPPAELRKTPFEYDLDTLSALALENSPLLKAGGKAIERDRTALTLAKREYLPDFAVSAGIANRGELTDMWEVQVGIDLPIYFWRNQRYGVREASEDLIASREDYQSIREKVLYHVKDLYEMSRTSNDLVTLYERGIIPQATLSLESATAGYGVGNVDFLTLLDNLITLLEDELKYTKELTRFEKSLARLEEVVGVRFTDL